jgi:hypothetical protein
MYDETTKTWYPEPDPDPLRGDPNSADVLALIRSLHSRDAVPWGDQFLTAEDRRYWRER